MKRTILKLLFGVLLILLSAADASDGVNFTFYNFTKADMEQVMFPNATKIVFRSPSIKELSSTLMNRIGAVEYLQLDGGTVRTIYVKPTLSSLWAQNNTVQEVLIDDGDNHQLGFLEVTFNKLKSVPANINRLKKLIHLHLNDNEIEEVNLHALNGLDNLKHLKLYKNRIILVDTTAALKLPSLVEISFSENQLDHLNMSLWDFPNLESLHLERNKLRLLKGFSKKFIALKVVSMHGNRWSCVWLQNIIDEFHVRNVTVHHKEQCSNRNEDGICCEDSEEHLAIAEQFDQVKARLSREHQVATEINTNVQKLAEKLRVLSTDSLDRDKNIVQHEEKLDTMNEFMKTMEQKFKDELRALKSTINVELDWIKQKLNENRAAIDDVIEDLYLGELEK